MSKHVKYYLMIKNYSIVIRYIIKFEKRTPCERGINSTGPGFELNISSDKSSHFIKNSFLKNVILQSGSPISNLDKNKINAKIIQ